MIVLLAVALRLAFVCAVQTGVMSFESNADYQDYFSFAHNLVTGVGFAHSVNESQPFSQPVEFSAWRPPLYPMLLALVFHVSRSFWWLRY